MKFEIEKVAEHCEGHICPDCCFVNQKTGSCLWVDLPARWNGEALIKAYGEMLKNDIQCKNS